MSGRAVDVHAHERAARGAAGAMHWTLRLCYANVLLVVGMLVYVLVTASAATHHWDALLFPYVFFAGVAHATIDRKRAAHRHHAPSLALARAVGVIALVFTSLYTFLHGARLYRCARDRADPGGSDTDRYVCAAATGEFPGHTIASVAVGAFATLATLVHVCAFIVWLVYLKHYARHRAPRAPHATHAHHATLGRRYAHRGDADAPLKRLAYAPG